MKSIQNFLALLLLAFLVVACGGGGGGSSDAGGANNAEEGANVVKTVSNTKITGWKGGNIELEILSDADSTVMVGYRTETGEQKQFAVTHAQKLSLPVGSSPQFSVLQSPIGQACRLSVGKDYIVMPADIGVSIFCDQQFIIAPSVTVYEGQPFVAVIYEEGVDPYDITLKTAEGEKVASFEGVILQGVLMATLPTASEPLKIEVYYQGENAENQIGSFDAVFEQIPTEFDADFLESALDKLLENPEGNGLNDAELQELQEMQSQLTQIKVNLNNLNAQQRYAIERQVYLLNQYREALQAALLMTDGDIAMRGFTVDSLSRCTKLQLSVVGLAAGLVLGVTALAPALAVGGVSLGPALLFAANVMNLQYVMSSIKDSTFSCSYFTTQIKHEMDEDFDYGNYGYRSEALALKDAIAPQINVNGLLLVHQQPYRVNINVIREMPNAFKQVIIGLQATMDPLKQHFPQWLAWLYDVEFVSRLEVQSVKNAQLLSGTNISGSVSAVDDLRLNVQLEFVNADLAQQLPNKAMPFKIGATVVAKDLGFNRNVDVNFSADGLLSLQDPTGLGAIIEFEGEGPVIIHLPIEFATEVFIENYPQYGRIEATDEIGVFHYYPSGSNTDDSFTYTALNMQGEVTATINLVRTSYCEWFSAETYYCRYVYPNQGFTLLAMASYEGGDRVEVNLQKVDRAETTTWESHTSKYARVTTSDNGSAIWEVKASSHWDSESNDYLKNSVSLTRTISGEQLFIGIGLVENVNYNIHHKRAYNGITGIYTLSASCGFRYEPITQGDKVVDFETIPTSARTISFRDLSGKVSIMGSYDSQFSHQYCLNRAEYDSITPLRYDMPIDKESVYQFFHP